MTAPSSHSRETFSVPDAMRRRQWIMRGAWSIVIALALLAALDHTGAFGSHGDDWAAFDRRQVVVTAMYDFRTFAVRTDEGREDTVVLLGVAPPDGRWSDEAAAYVARNMLGKVVTLRLEPTRTRDASRHLLAYLFLSDEDNVNLDLIRLGLAKADPIAHTLAPQFGQAQSDARKKSLGTWGGDQKLNSSTAGAPVKAKRRHTTVRRSTVRPSTRPSAPSHAK